MHLIGIFLSTHLKVAPHPNKSITILRVSQFIYFKLMIV
jgi:hypothetical protein